LCLLAREEFLLKILWDQAAQQRNPRQTNFTHYFCFLVCFTIVILFWFNFWTGLNTCIFYILLTSYFCFFLNHLFNQDIVSVSTFPRQVRVLPAWDGDSNLAKSREKYNKLRCLA
jgi:hypothetical protein